MASVWNSSHSEIQILPLISNCGWEINDEREYIPIATLDVMIPERLNKFIKCKCITSCGVTPYVRCSCVLGKTSCVLIAKTQTSVKGSILGKMKIFSGLYVKL